jgi:hypothetical protein
VSEPHQGARDETRPDLLRRRCPQCNPDGMNRTGRRPIGPYRATSTIVWTVRCEQQCDHGRIETPGAVADDIAADFKAGHSMDTLARQLGVTILVIEDAIRQVLRRQGAHDADP